MRRMSSGYQAPLCSSSSRTSSRVMRQSPARAARRNDTWTARRKWPGEVARRDRMRSVGRRPDGTARSRQDVLIETRSAGRQRISRMTARPLGQLPRWRRRAAYGSAGDRRRGPEPSRSSGRCRCGRETVEPSAPPARDVNRPQRGDHPDVVAHRQLVHEGGRGVVQQVGVVHDQHRAAPPSSLDRLADLDGEGHALQGQVGGEQRHHRGQRQAGGRRRAGRGDHVVAVGRHLAGELRGQAALADTGRAGQEHAAPAATKPIESGGEVVFPPREGPCRHRPKYASYGVGSCPDGFRPEWMPHCVRLLRRSIALAFAAPTRPPGLLANSAIDWSLSAEPKEYASAGRHDIESLPNDSSVSNREWPQCWRTSRKI